LAKNNFIDAVLLAKKVFVLRNVVAMVQNTGATSIGFSDQRAFKDVFKVDVFANQVRKVYVFILASTSIHELAQGIYNLLKVLVVVSIGSRSSLFIAMSLDGVRQLRKVGSECSGGDIGCL